MKKIGEEISKLGFNKRIKESLYQEYIKSLKNSNFKRLVESLPLEEEYLMKYTTKLQMCVKELENCKNCKSIFECKNEVKGYFYKPEVLGKTLRFSYIPCRYQIEIIKNNKYKENIYYFDIPKEIKEARMSNIYTSRKNRIEVISWLKNFINNYQLEKLQKGLYLYGNFGSGKTYLIAAAFNELASRGNKTAIIYWPEFLRELKASFDSGFDSKFNYIKKVPLLLIDDIGAENSTSWARDEILGSILQYRMQEKIPTFLTSNFNLNELETHFSDNSYKTDKVKAKRIIERINQVAVPMEMISKNNRE